MSTDQNIVPAGSTTNPGIEEITDTTGNVVALFQGHNADNQLLAGTAYGLNVGGVGQTLSPAGTQDRTRGTGFDSVPTAGIPAGAQQLFMPFAPAPTFTGQASTGAKTYTVSALSGMSNGVAWSIQVGSYLKVDVGANQEIIFVTAVNVGTPSFSTTVAIAHTGGSVAIVGGVYNQARDSAGVIEGGAPIGISPSLTMLWNSSLNAGAGGVEFDRSANGEQDLANGTGTAVAAEYEFDGIAYSRERNILGMSSIYTDVTTAAGITAGSSVVITVVGGFTAAQLAQMIGSQIVLDPDNVGVTELVKVSAGNVGSKTLTLTTVANNHVASIHIAAAIQGAGSGPQNVTAIGLSGEAAMLYSGQHATLKYQQYSVEQDVNAAGLSPTQGTAASAGMDADVDYGIFRAYASLPALADKQMTPVQMDTTGNVKVGTFPGGTPVYGSANGGAQVNAATLTIPAAKMGYLDGFDVEGGGATAGSVILVTVVGLLGGTLTFAVGIPTGAAVPITVSKRFNPPLQASAVNTNIVVSSPSFGAGNTGASVNAFGRYI